jgi:hypothetical protein
MLKPMTSGPTILHTGYFSLHCDMLKSAVAESVLVQICMPALLKSAVAKYVLVQICTPALLKSAVA